MSDDPKKENERLFSEEAFEDDLEIKANVDELPL